MREIDHAGQSSRRASRGTREDAKKCPENDKEGRETLPPVGHPDGVKQTKLPLTGHLRGIAKTTSHDLKLNARRHNHQHTCSGRAGSPNCGQCRYPRDVSLPVSPLT